MTLEEILTATEAESQDRQARLSLKDIVRKVAKMKPTRGFARSIARADFSVIAEIKRKSPSMGEINPRADEVAVPVYHHHHFVSAISVLTQFSAFGGSPEILASVRHRTQCKPKPILRKDFIFSEYEVFFSRYIGADAILLMANVVKDAAEFKRLHDLAIELGMDVLCEVHDEEEISRLPDTVRICGINSRKFKNAKHKTTVLQRISNSLAISSNNKHDTRTDTSVFSLYDKLPTHCIKIAESGISKSNLKGVLDRYSFDAALVGTSLLKDTINVGALAADQISGQISQLEEIYKNLQADFPVRGHVGRELVGAH